MQTKIDLGLSLNLKLKACQQYLVLNTTKYYQVLPSDYKVQISV